MDYILAEYHTRHIVKPGLGLLITRGRNFKRSKFFSEILSNLLRSSFTGANYREQKILKY